MCTFTNAFQSSSLYSSNMLTKWILIDKIIFSNLNVTIKADGNSDGYLFADRTDIARGVLAMIYTIFLFIIAGLAEIGGGYLIWLWLREGKPLYLGIFGGVALALYGVIATFQSFSSFGRIYAAYGGVFIILSLL